MPNRTLNFSAGPTALPLSVLKRVRAELYNFNKTGVSIMELSHRSDDIQFIISDSVERIKRLFGLDEQFEVVFLQGGGSLQFTMIPMNFSRKGEKVDYVDTGYWARKAIEEAEILERDVAVIASSKDNNYINIPNSKDIKCRPDTKYLHICTNNTIFGTQWHEIPKVPVPLVTDMSSDFMSRAFDLSPLGCIYAHAQKNLGIAGVTIVIIRGDMLNNIPDNLPTVLDYRTHIKHNSNYHTPPCFAIYITWLMLQWIEEEIGGLKEMEKINIEKATLLYDFIDSSSLYSNPIEQKSRSLMNIVFSLSSKQLENKFLYEASNNRIMGLAGHRSVGGCRASLYNGVKLKAVKQLVDFMYKFEKEYH